MNIDFSIRRGLLLASTCLLLLAGCGDEGCPTGFESCDGICTDTNASADHCGACGNVCGTGEVCTAGLCETQCPDGQSACDGACFDTSADVAHCGACGVACDSGEVCMAGACSAQCGVGFANCGGSCRDLETDPTNCGGCGAACDSGFGCAGGECLPTCGVNQVVCAGVCSDTQTDRGNCGGCGVACDTSEVCAGGSCTTFCADLLTACPGGCRDLQSDPNNCGACAVRCAPGSACMAGVCEASCGGGTPDVCGDACVDLQSNPNFCGDCTTACPLGAVCNLGVCEGVCTEGLTDCSGACVDVSSDPNNCGGCGTMCAAPAMGGVAVCAASECSAVCPADTADCNGDLLEATSDGCEVTPATDVSNCGACGNVCELDNASAACTDGACAIGMCDADFADCDLDPATGCEVDTLTDPNNCGGCGTACAITEECSAGTCTPLTLVGDNCSNPIVITDGTSTNAWTAVVADVMTAVPACQTFAGLDGPDLVFEYTATATDSVTVGFERPATGRWTAQVTDTCTSVTPDLACTSDFTSSDLEVSFAATMGTTYYIWIRDTDSGGVGTFPLTNPMTVTVTVGSGGSGGGLQPGTGTYDRTPIGTCTPGMGGIAGVGPDQLFDSQEVDFPTWVVADDTAAAMGGFLYWGDGFKTYQIRKDGTGASVDIDDALSLGSLEQGNAGIVDGSNVYILDDGTGTDRLFRVSSDGGATFLEETAGVEGTADDGFDAIAIYDGLAYVVAEETSTATGSATEIYSYDLSAPFPVMPTLITSLTGIGERDCNGIAVDDDYFYLACATFDRIVRVDRTTFAVELLTGLLDLSTTSNVMYAVDTDTPPDGVADVLYVKANNDGLSLVCDPGAVLGASGAAAGTFYTYATGSGDEGLAYDADANTLYIYDGSTDEIRVIP